MQLKILMVWLFLFLGCRPAFAQKPIRMIGLHQPIIVGEINGKKAYFLIDTGADVTVLDSKNGKKYNYQTRKLYSDNYKLTGLNAEHVGEIFVTKLTELRIGDKIMKGSYKALDLTHIVRSIAHEDNIRIAGIIGSDLMRQYDFVINYGTRRVTFATD